MGHFPSPQLCAAAAASLPGFPRESLEPGLYGNTVQYPLRPQEGSAHPRTSARKIRWTLRSALLAPKVSSLGSRHQHLVRALSLTLLAASLGKTSLVSEEKGQNPHTDYICPGVKNPWTALSGLPGKGWTKTAQGLPKINILRGFLLFAGSSLAPSRSPR